MNHDETKEAGMNKTNVPKNTPQLREISCFVLGLGCGWIMAILILWRFINP